jgi:hypothetical protein
MTGRNLPHPVIVRSTIRIPISAPMQKGPSTPSGLETASRSGLTEAWRRVGGRAAVSCAFLNRSGEELPEELKQSFRTIDDEIGIIDQCRWRFRRVHRDA